MEIIPLVFSFGKSDTTETGRTLPPQTKISPKTKCKTFEGRAFKSGPVPWNSLPDNIGQVTYVPKFKKELKTLLYGLAYK